MESSAGPAHRVAWLLRVNRRLAEDEALRSGRTFARAFRPDRPLASSHVTRWEAGSLSPARGTIGRYEELLTLAPGSLTAISDTVQRMGDAAVDPPPVDLAESGHRARLHELLDQALVPSAMTGVDWTELSRLISAYRGLELHPPRLWNSVASQLLNELVVAVDSSWLQRQEAMSRLLEHPAAGPHAVQACIALAEDPTSPAVIEPLSLLNVTTDPRANKCVLDNLGEPGDDRAMHGALLAAVRKIRRGHFRETDWTRLAGSISTMVRDPHVSEAHLPVLVDAGRQLLRRMPTVSHLRRSLDSPRVMEHLRHAPVASLTRELSLRVTRLAQAEIAGEQDPLDTTLAATIEDAIFGVDPDDRLFATMLIGATPYRLPVARALLGVLREDLVRRTSAYPLRAVLRALTQLGVDHHRPLVRTLLLRPDGDVATRQAAAWALPHCAGRYPVPVWRDILEAQRRAWSRSLGDGDREVLQAIVYGIGTDGHRTLVAEIRDSSDVPEVARTMAAWQLAAGVPLP